MKGFGQWSEKRERIVTGENFSDETNFYESTDCLSRLSNVGEVNPTINELELVGDIMKRGKEGFYYARTDHNNFAQLEEGLKQIEVGRLSHPEYFSCKVFPSGMAAIKSTLEALSLDEELDGFGPDSIFIYGNGMYPSTKELLKDQGRGRNMIGGMPGMELDLKNTKKLKETLEESPNYGTTVLGIIMEPVANPTIEYTDVRKIAEIAHEHEVPLIVDNTFLTPFLLEPFRMGADVVIHSLTKYFSGQGDMTGGAVIMPKELEADVQDVRKHGGSIMSIKDAYEFSKRVNSVGSRIHHHSQNAQILSKELRKVKGIKVNYNNLQGETRNGHAGGVLSFEFKGDDMPAYRKARDFSKYIMENSYLARHAVSFGEPKTLAFSYAGLVDIAQLKSMNIPTGLVRIATGREPKFSSIVAPHIKIVAGAVSESL